MKRLKLTALFLTLLLLFSACGEAEGPEVTDAPAEETAAPTAKAYDTSALLQPDETDWATLKPLSEELTRPEKTDEPNTVTEAVAWVANELVLEAEEKYRKPLAETELDLILTNGTDTYTVPGFWDGQKTWRVRFYCPKAGTWTYRTVCSNENDTGLHNVTGTIECKEYTGSLPLYRHGFVKAGNKHFVYDDGTPFFYLGDTHWSLGGETADMVERTARTRLSQGYTVWQSEPIDADFQLIDGLTSEDLPGFKKFDEKMQIIADYGFMHANAAFFFTPYMNYLIERMGGYSDKTVGQTIHTGNPMKGVTVYELADETKEYLREISRYWVARYGAYPVMWTLGQEIDNDSYWESEGFNSHEEWNYLNNPYRFVAQCFGEADAYKHPLSAHQEGMSVTACSNSAFRDIPCHTWYAAQWSQTYDWQIDPQWFKDYWENSEGKPSILYESRYCYLWTKNFGSRLQGWTAYLSGLYGYGWGGQDTWSYLNPYNEDDISDDGVDIITPEDKKNATWEDSLAYDSAFQVGYMRAFLEGTVKNWYELVPRFGDPAYFLPDAHGVYYVSAGTDTQAIFYFYSTDDTSICEKPNADAATARLTGTVAKLKKNQTYAYVWLDPITGEKSNAGTFVASNEGTWKPGEKPRTDAVLYLFLI